MSASLQNGTHGFLLLLLTDVTKNRSNRRTQQRPGTERSACTHCQLLPMLRVHLPSNRKTSDAPKGVTETESQTWCYHSCVAQRHVTGNIPHTAAVQSSTARPTCAHTPLHLHMNLRTPLRGDLTKRPAISAPPAAPGPPHSPAAPGGGPRPGAPRVPARGGARRPSPGPGGTWSRWALLRCMLRAGLLGSTLPQPGTVHRMLVLTWDSSVTEGRTSSRAGGGSPAGGCPRPPPRRPAAAMLLSGARAPLPGVGRGAGLRPLRHGASRARGAQLKLRVSGVSCCARVRGCAAASRALGAACWCSPHSLWFPSSAFLATYIVI